ncbi:MAG: PTS mannitol transporter subunit IICBA [Eubacteriales bacterium]|nr:PTS mannitol transporter subunit IICBA [Eubacteriales bacterium]
MSNASLSQQTGFRAKIQHFGRFLSGMVMPNIGAFLAWGLITALFIPTGWTPSENLAKLVGPMIVYLLPILIGYTGGKTVYGIRGGVVGAVATMGVIIGSDIPMFLGAMIMGPLGGWVIKEFDRLVEGKIKAGFEMLVNNFSAGILGGALAVLGLVGIGPVVTSASDALGSAVGAIVSAGLIPLASILVEPAKILFLNNAINHGVLAPIGVEQAATAGKSIMFLIETNPGPGLGILAAYWAFSKGNIKMSAPGAIIIHFFGGIHEVYFPYVLMKPILILAAIAGGASGVATFAVLNAGLVATPSPGSIFALLIMTPKGAGNFLATIAGVAVAAVVSFLVAGIFLKADKTLVSDDDLVAATAQTAAIKGSKLNAATTAQAAAVAHSTIKEIIFACDAGMGSSAMGATTLKKSLEKAGLKIAVVHKAVNEIPADAQIVVTHEGLTERARAKAPNAMHYSIKNFLSASEYDQLVNSLK